MTFFIALVIFLGITTTIWFIAVALYQSIMGGPDLRQNPNFAWASLVSILLVTVISFVPFPAGFLFSLAVWWLAGKTFLELPFGRATVLFLLLAGLSIISRLAILGALDW